MPDGAAVLYAAARWLGYLAAFVLVGAATTRWIVLPRAGVDPSTPGDHGAVRVVARLGTVAALVLMGVHLLRLYLQTRSLLDPEEPVTTAFVQLVLESSWGTGWSWQLTAAIVGFFAWAGAGARPALVRVLTIATALLVVGSAPLTGHAVGLHTAGRIGPWLDGLHFAGGGLWLGTLAATAVVALGARPRISPARAIAAFSPVGLVGGGIAMAAGTIMGYRYLGGVAALFETAYGRVLLLKIATLALVAALGAYNWRVVLPRLRASDDPGAVRRTARIELAIGTILLAVTAVLVALPAPGE